MALNPLKISNLEQLALKGLMLKVDTIGWMSENADDLPVLRTEVPLQCCL